MIHQFLIRNGHRCVPPSAPPTRWPRWGGRRRLSPGWPPGSTSPRPRDTLWDLDLTTKGFRPSYQDGSIWRNKINYVSRWTNVQNVQFVHNVLSVSDLGFLVYIARQSTQQPQGAWEDETDNSPYREEASVVILLARVWTPINWPATIAVGGQPKCMVTAFVNANRN